VAFTQVTVTGNYQNPDGSPASGGVRFTPTVQMRNATSSSEINARTAVHIPITGGVLGPGSLAATTDPGTTPAGVATYEVTEYVQGQPRLTYFIEVPHDAGTINLNTHPRAGEVPISGQNFYASLAHTHPVGDLAVSGTASDSTFLRGDGAWAVPAGGAGTDQSGRAAALAMILGGV
jgi:hypothetical protein